MAQFRDYISSKLCHLLWQSLVSLVFNRLDGIFYVHIYLQVYSLGNYVGTKLSIRHLCTSPGFGISYLPGQSCRYGPEAAM